MTLTPFQKSLKRLMKLSKLNQNKLSKAVGMSQSSISQYVRGQFKPNQASLNKLKWLINELGLKIRIDK